MSGSKSIAYFKKPAKNDTRISTKSEKNNTTMTKKSSKEIDTSMKKSLTRAKTVKTLETPKSKKKS